LKDEIERPALSHAGIPKNDRVFYLIFQTNKYILSNKRGEKLGFFLITLSLCKTTLTKNTHFVLYSIFKKSFKIVDIFFEFFIVLLLKCCDDSLAYRSFLAQIEFFLLNVYNEIDDSVC
jgi:hypothetical protein